MSKIVKTLVLVSLLGIGVKSLAQDTAIPVFSAEVDPVVMFRAMNELLFVLKSEVARLSAIRRAEYQKMQDCNVVCRESKKANLKFNYDKAKKLYRAAVEKEILYLALIRQSVAKWRSQLSPEEFTKLQVPANEMPKDDSVGEVVDEDEQVDFLPGGPVVNTDDPFPPDFGSLELNVYAATDRIFHAPEGVVPLIIQLNYIDANLGIDRFQVKLEAGLPTISGGNGNPYTVGVDVWAAGVKVRLFGHEDGLAGGIYPQYGSSFGNRYLYVPWLMSYERKKWAAVTNIGILKGTNLTRDDNPDLFIYSLAFGVPVTKKWSAMGEYFSQKPLNGDVRNADRLISTGGRVKPEWLKKIPYATVLYYNVGADRDSDRKYHLAARFGIQFNRRVVGEDGLFHKHIPVDNGNQGGGLK